MADYRVLVTGSRDWPSAHAVNTALDELLAEHGCLIVVHGAARDGADKMAQNWTLSASISGAVIGERHPADWNTWGKTAGFRRNAEMIALGASVCLAFIMPCANAQCRRPGPHGSHGASHCAQLAEASGIETRRFTDA